MHIVHMLRVYDAAVQLTLPFAGHLFARGRFVGHARRCALCSAVLTEGRGWSLMTTPLGTSEYASCEVLRCR